MSEVWRRWSWRSRVSLKGILVLLTTSLTLAIIWLSFWLFQLNQKMSERLNQGWFLPPIEIYSGPEALFPGQNLDLDRLQGQLESQGYRQRQAQQRLLPKDFALWDLGLCASHLSDPLPWGTQRCLVIRHPHQIELLALDSHKVLALYQGEPLLPVGRLELPPQLFAQFYGDQPILRDVRPLGAHPLQCLQAVTAIEDSQFLEHSGISFSGIGRALLRNFSSGRFAEGGSTITQQLVKNYFLTHEKTLRRKFVEFFMALLLELQVEKEEILEAYLNVIYMGQNGPFQVRGFASAAQHYFGRNLETLALSDCALLAAIINSPGRYNPFQSPEQSLSRRNLVLNRMLSLGMVDTEAADQALQAPLPSRPPRSLSDPAPYYVQAVMRELRRQKLPLSQGLRVFTGLDPQAQDLAQQVVQRELERLEKNHETTRELKEKGFPLQAGLVAVDIESRQVLALVGGRNYRQSQFNRITEARRQVGSVMKPLVYLSALESLQATGLHYNPLTPLSDESFTHHFSGQTWSPKNYDQREHGLVPMFFGLAQSLNLATAQLGLDVGLSSLLDLSRRLGIESELQALPSLTLGAFELRPWEVAQVFTSLARFGQKTSLHLLHRVEDLSGQVLWRRPEDRESWVVAPENAAVLVGMMKQSMTMGTARSLSWRGFRGPGAGKTGTTSDYRDAWFVGFSPKVLALTWLGYDDNQSSGLTGASGALPFWAEFMKGLGQRHGEEDFAWPPGTYARHLRALELARLYPQLDFPPEGVELIFRSQDQPFDP